MANSQVSYGAANVAGVSREELTNARLAYETRQAQRETIGVTLDRQAAFDRGFVDFNFFAGLAAPSVMRTQFPVFYLNLFALLTKIGMDPEAILRFALGLPRGFAKTTFLKILACWLIVYKRNQFFLVVCETAQKALDLIDGLDEMLGSPSMEAVYGNWNAAKSIDNAKRKIAFLGDRKIVLVPMGAMSSVRGLNIGNERPDCILVDDVQSRDGAMSEVQNTSLTDWFVSSLLKCLPPWGANRLVIFLGNMYPGECLLAKLRDNPEWISLITGAILDDGNSIWPELKSIKALFAEYRHDAGMGLGDIWFAEVQNDPLDANFRLLARAIPNAYDQRLIDTPPDAVFLICDPAGFRKKSDDNVISIIFVYDNNPVCIGMKGGRWDPMETVKQLLTTAIEYNACLIAIESVGYQQSLLFWVKYFMEKLSLENQIPIVEVTTNNATKIKRIQDYIAELLAGTAGMAMAARTVFSYFAGLYKLGKQNNRDDYLDCPSYSKQVMTKYPEHLIAGKNRGIGLAELPPVEDVDIGV